MPRTISIYCWATAGILASGYATHADELHVPSDFTSIQSAINAANDGDEVIVAPGTYDGAIDFQAKTILVRSAAGPEETIIDATGSGTAAGAEAPGPDYRPVDRGTAA